MKIQKNRFNKDRYKSWELGLVLTVDRVSPVFTVKYKVINSQIYSRLTLRAASVSDALEEACFACSTIHGCRPEQVDLHAVYDEQDNLLWIDEPFYGIVQKKGEFRGIDRRSFLQYFGATGAAILFGLRPIRSFAGSSVTPLSGTASGFTVIGEQIFTSSTTWTVPANVTSVCIVAVGAGGTGDDGNSGDGGGGGGGGGALAYANSVSVTAGASHSITVGLGNSNANGYGTRAANGGSSSVTIGSYVLTANGGQGGAPYPTSPGSTGGTPSHSNTPGGASTGGGSGGDGGAGYDGGGGGGGAGGYNGSGGNGSGAISSQAYSTGWAGVGIGSGGGGGAYYAEGSGNNGGGNGGSGQSNLTGGGGGGANIYTGTVNNGAVGNGSTSAGSKGGNGGFPGGGGGGSYDNGTGVAATGGNGVVRIIWGPSRSFPSNAT